MSKDDWLKLAKLLLEERDRTIGTYAGIPAAREVLTALSNVAKFMSEE